MDLKTRKYIHNSKIRFPKFGDGTTSYDDEMEYQEALLGGEFGGDAKNKIPAADTLSEKQDRMNTYKNAMKSGVDISNTTLGDGLKSGANAAAEAAAAPAGDALSNAIAGGKESTAGDITGAVASVGLGAVGTAFGGPIGGAIGSVVGKGIGGIVTSLFGKDPMEAWRQEQIDKENKRLRDQLIASTQKQQEQNRSRFLRKYASVTNPTIFGAAYGKQFGVDMPSTTLNKDIVNTAYGKQQGEQNAWVEKGEFIWRKLPQFAFGTPGLHRITEGPDDTAKAYLSPYDVVFSNRVINPATGNKIAKDVPLYAKYGMLDELEYELEVGLNMKMSKNKRFPKMSLGGVLKDASKYLNGNLASTLLSLSAARKQYNEASLPLYKPDIYAPNEQFGAAMRGLESLYLPYNIIAQQNLNTERRAANAIANSAGLSAGQRMRGYAQLNHATQRNNAESLFKNMLQNNQYRQIAAQARMQAGQDAAKLKFQSNLFGEEQLAKAHNASILGRNMSLFNTMNALQQYYANEFKRNLSDKTIAMYQQELDGREKDRQIAALNMLNNNNYGAKYQWTFPSDHIYNYQIGPLGIGRKRSVYGEY